MEVTDRMLALPATIEVVDLPTDVATDDVTATASPAPAVIEAPTALSSEPVQAPRNPPPPSPFGLIANSRPIPDDPFGPESVTPPRRNRWRTPFDLTTERRSKSGGERIFGARGPQVDDATSLPASAFDVDADDPLARHATPRPVSAAGGGIDRAEPAPWIAASVFGLGEAPVSREEPTRTAPTPVPRHSIAR